LGEKNHGKPNPWPERVPDERGKSYEKKNEGLVKRGGRGCREPKDQDYFLPVGKEGRMPKKNFSREKNTKYQGSARLDPLCVGGKERTNKGEKKAPSKRKVEQEAFPMKIYDTGMHCSRPREVGRKRRSIFW